MGKQKLIKYSNGAYHVNAKTNNSEWFPLPLKDCWHIYGHYISEMEIKYNVRIHAFTLMSNHFHLLCSTPDKNLDRAMNFFMQMTSKGINHAANRKNHLYGGRYYWTHTSCAVGYAAIYKYILRNPIRAKICKGVQFYPWTTYFNDKIKFNISRNELDELVPENNLLVWVNFCPVEFDESIFNKIFKKSEFKMPKSRVKRKKADLDSYLINGTT